MLALTMAFVVFFGVVFNIIVFVELKDREYAWSIGGTRLDHKVTRVIICVLSIIPWAIAIIYGIIFIGGLLFAWVESMIAFIKEP